MATARNQDNDKRVQVLGISRFGPRSGSNLVLEYCRCQLRNSNVVFYALENGISPSLFRRRLIHVTNPNSSRRLHISSLSRNFSDRNSTVHTLERKTAYQCSAKHPELHYLPCSVIQKPDCSLPGSVLPVTVAPMTWLAWPFVFLPIESCLVRTLHMYHSFPFLLWGVHSY